MIDETCLYHAQPVPAPRFFYFHSGLRRSSKHISRQTRVAQVFRSVIDGDSNADDRDDDPVTLALMSGAYVKFLKPGLMFI